MMEIFTRKELDSLILVKKSENCEANWYKSAAAAAEQESADACRERLKKKGEEKHERDYFQHSIAVKGQPGPTQRETLCSGNTQNL